MMSILNKFGGLSIFLLFSISVFTQNDSLINALPAMPDDSNKVKVLGKLAYSFIYSDREKSKQYIDELRELCQKLGDDKGVRYARYLWATNIHFGGENERSEKEMLAVIAECREAGDKENLALALNVLNFIYKNQYKMDLALEAILESLELCKELGDKRREAIAYHTLASTYSMIDEKNTSKNYLLKAIPIFEEVGDKRGTGVMYQSLAVLSIGQQAIDYARQGLEYLEGSYDIQAKGMCYWMIGDGHYELEDYEPSIENYREALAIFEEMEYTEGIGQIVSRIGLVLSKTGKYDEGLPYLERGRNIERQLEYPDMLLQVYQGMAFYNMGKNNIKSAIQFVDSLQMIKDSLFNIEKSDQLLITEARLQTKEKEAQIAQQELQLERESNIRNLILFLSSFIILGIGGIFFYLRNRQRQKQKDSEMALQLEKAKAEQLEELDELKSNFFANISHEFRTPLTLILGPLDQMRKGIFTGDREKYYHLMHRNGERLQELINQLLDLSKLESNKMSLNLQGGDLHSLVRQLAASLESWAEQKDIKYIVEVPETPLWVEYDRDKLEKILVNLLSNAMKFTESGGQVEISVSSTDRDNDVDLQLTISDTGVGIAQQALDKIFERFYHREQGVNGNVSSGIGLALVKELVHFQGGEIQVESEEGVGTVFRINLSFKKTEAQLVEADSHIRLHVPVIPTLEEQEIVDAGGDPAQNLLLLVEDNADVRTYIKDILTGKFRIIEAENGKEGIEKAEASIPDLIISDLMMPEMDGVEMTKYLKNNAKTDHIPLIMLTAKADRKDKLEGLDTGADDYLTKPFDGEELLARINNLIKTRKKLKEKFKSSLFLRPGEVKVASQEEKFLQEVGAEIEKNMGNELYGVEELASAMGFSRSQLYRKLKSICDQSPNEMIRNFRLIRGKELIEQNKATISEIAYEVGYANLSYFSREFKKKFGISPSEV